MAIVGPKNQNKENKCDGLLHARTGNFKKIGPLPTKQELKLTNIFHTYVYRVFF